MFINLKDAEGKMLDFDTGIYDFKTEVFKEEKIEEVVNISETEVELLAAPDVSLEKDAAAESETGNIETIAMTATETPATGAETWVIIFATLIINTFFFLARKKKVQMA